MSRHYLMPNVSEAVRDTDIKILCSPLGLCHGFSSHYVDIKTVSRLERLFGRASQFQSEVTLIVLGAAEEDRRRKPVSSSVGSGAGTWHRRPGVAPPGNHECLIKSSHRRLVRPDINDVAACLGQPPRRCVLSHTRQISRGTSHLPTTMRTQQQLLIRIDWFFV